MSKYHISVLLQETLEALRVEKGKKYIDATLGGGGHSLEILKCGGKVLGIDVDQDALDNILKDSRFKIQDLRIGEDLVLARGNFKDIDALAKENGFENVSGILFDLGVSSHQFDTAERGFSFRFDSPLDMRMDKSLGVTAADLVNALTRRELTELFTKLGEEPFARRIADAILVQREKKKIETTTELAKIAERAYPGGFHKIHPATKIFQALRIAVNDELNVIREALPKALQLLDHGGRLVVISFHSLEDRVVKDTFKEFEIVGLGKIVTEKPIEPGFEEQEVNRRSRSSKLRIFEKIRSASSE